MSGKCWILLLGLGLAAIVAMSEASPMRPIKRMVGLKRMAPLKREAIVKRDLDLEGSADFDSMFGSDSDDYDDDDEPTSREALQGLLASLLDISEEDLDELTDEELEELTGIIVLLAAFHEEVGERKKKSIP